MGVRVTVAVGVAVDGRMEAAREQFNVKNRTAAEIKINQNGCFLVMQFPS